MESAHEIRIIKIQCGRLVQQHVFLYTVDIFSLQHTDGIVRADRRQVICQRAYGYLNQTAMKS